MQTQPLKLNRSYSETDLSNANFNSNFQNIVMRRTVVEEIIVKPGVIKRYPSQQIVSSSVTDLRDNHNRHPANTSLNSDITDEITNLWLGIQNLETGTNFFSNKSKVEVCISDVSPMEVDGFSNPKAEKSVENMDVEYYQDNEEINRTSKIRNLKQSLPSDSYLKQIDKTKVVPKKPEEINRRNSLKLTFFALLVSACSYVIFISDIFIFVNNDVQIENIKTDLTERIHGQNSAVQTVVTSLEQRRHWQSKIKLLVFVGTSGVGKTFITNMVKRHFHGRLVNEVYGSHLNNVMLKEKVLQNLHSCCLNLIIVDDLRESDSTELLAFMHSLPKDIFILVISVFNIQYADDQLRRRTRHDEIIKIRDNVESSKIYHEMVVFKEFNEDHVKDWIKKQLEHQNVDKTFHGDVIQNVFEGHDITFNGLKGLHKKILLELEKINAENVTD